jgi:ATP-dependent Clp protease adaptor protein ClpS
MQTFFEEVEEIEVLEEEIDLADELSDIGTGSLAYLIVHNDDVNSFDWVIESFMDILDYPADQSEQLAVLIHYKGKATVKTAAFSELKPKQEGLVDRGLTATIEGGEEETAK